MQWDAESSFEQVKEARANVTLLYHPSRDAELALIIDCSNFAVGGVLEEVSPDGSKLLGFCSRKLSFAQ